MAFEAKDPKIRAYAVEEYLSGFRSQKSICNELGIGQATLSRWIKSHYKKMHNPKKTKKALCRS